MESYTVFLSRVGKYSSRIVSREELGNLLDKFETDILGNISEKMDIMRLKKKQKKMKMLFCLYYVLDVERNMNYDNVYG